VVRIHVPQPFIASQCYAIDVRQSSLKRSRIWSGESFDHNPDAKGSGNQRVRFGTGERADNIEARGDRSGSLAGTTHQPFG
jgi:hypothetical protein